MPPRSGEPPIFFVDRSLGRHKVPDALRAAGLEIRVHDELFSKETADEVWLEHCGKHRWIVLTKDDRIRFRVGERQALSEHGVAAFILAAGSITGEMQAAAFVAALKKIQAMLEKEKKRPLLASVHRDGTVTKL
jgi:hypothetical protein